ncbi:MAG: hypothetical protein KDD47_12100, partial [Acidobacteria bacterium]|nr:hypothetical protein [Acidobacteriota bacterium]
MRLSRNRRSACLGDRVKLWILLLGAGCLLGAGSRPAVPAAGRPGLDPEDPRHFVMDGRPWVPLGYTPGLGAMTLRRDGASLADFYRAYHSWLADRGLNYYRAVFSFGQAFEGRKNEETMPYLRLGPGRAIDGKPRFDLDRFDPEHFAHWRRVISDAGAKGIVVQLAIFDSWHLNQADRSSGWGRLLDPYHGENNVNGVTFDLGGEGSWHRADGGSEVYWRQRALVRKVVEELGDLPNLVWEIANEPAEYHDSWALPLARYLKALDQDRHLVIPLDLPDHQHTPGMLPPEHLPEATHEALLRIRPRTTPLIVHNDAPGSFLPPALQREKAWAVLTAGAYLNYFSNREDLAHVRRSRSPESRGARFVGRVGEILRATGVDLRKLEPADSLVATDSPAGAWCLARPGEEYLVYKRSGKGNASVLLRGLPAAFRARWFDPRT